MIAKLFNISRLIPVVVGFFLILSIPYCHAGEISIIELNDGSVISGEVLSFDGSKWTIKSESIGMLKIEAAKVVSIQSRASSKGKSIAGTSSGSQMSATDIQAMEQAMIADEEIMAMIMNLQDDPEIQAILQDPEIMNAVNAGDVNALMANPKFIRLMENAQVKAITKEAVK